MLKNSIITVVIIAIIAYLLIRHMKNDYSSMFKKALATFPKDVVSNAEKIYRLETDNFSSNQFIKTFSAGMEPSLSTYPYGWTSIANNLWSKHPEYKPSGFLPFIENGTGKTKNFLKFPNFEAGLFSLCAFLSLSGNNPGRWFSTNVNSQNLYNEKISKIKTSFV